MKTNSPAIQPTTAGSCSIEPLESRRLCSVTVPSITGHFDGNLFFDSGQTEMVEFHITNQQKSKFSGTFTEGDGSAGILVGSINKRGIVTFTFQSTNLFSNFKGKARAALDDTGDNLYGDFITRLGKRSSTGSFSTTIDILDKKSG